jgi:hypothetical protein
MDMESLVELDRPAAYHVSPIFPPHTFRPGDLAQILPHTTGTTSTSKSKKGPSNDGDAESKDPVEGVVYKVSETKIVLAVGGKDGGKDKELDLPERCRMYVGYIFHSPCNRDVSSSSGIRGSKDIALSHFIWVSLDPHRQYQGR